MRGGGGVNNPLDTINAAATAIAAAESRPPHAAVQVKLILIQLYLILA